MANLLINTTVGGNTVITTSNIGTYALTSITSGQVTTALGFTPYNATNPSGYITSSASISGTASNITAYTINQNLGTASNPTFATVYTGTAGFGTGNTQWTWSQVAHQYQANSIRLWDQYSNYGGSGNPTSYGTIVHITGRTAHLDSQLYLGESGQLLYRSCFYGTDTWDAWQTLITSSNYTSYSPTLTGGNASGTWAINVTGTAARATRANGNFYIDDNYGNTIVGVYASTRYQGVFAMGDSYKLPADGTSTGSLYGLAWSHPNAGGVAANLNDHGLLVINNGVFAAAISSSIRAAADMRAPIFYDSNDTSYYLDPNGNSVLTTATFNVNASSILILTSAGTNASQIKAGAGDELYIGGNNTWQMRFNSGNVLMDNGGYLQNDQSLRAPIFYDSNDTAYYVDPNGTSNLLKLSTQTMAYNGMNPMSASSPYVDRYNGSAGYRNGTMGNGTVGLDVIGSNWGSGFIDSWSSPANQPNGSTSHWVGLQSIHYSHQNGTNFYGFQMLSGAETNRFYLRASWATPLSWLEIITTGNIGSQSVSYATTSGSLTSMNISQFTNNSGYITGISFANVSSKPTTISGYGITDALYQNRDTINVDAFNATGLYRGSTSGWSNRPTIAHNGGALLTIDTHPSDYHSQLFFDTGADRLYFRNANAGSWGSWLIMFHTGNYTSYVPTLTGTGASGTWSINVTGSAGSISGFNNPATGATANTIVYRDSSGDIYGRYIFGSYHNSSDNVDTGGITYIMAKFGDNYHRSATAAKVQAFLGLGSLAYSSATIPTNNNQLTNGAGYITGISFASVSSKPTTISGYGITDAITTANIGSQSVSYATTAGSAPNAGNVNDFYNVTAALGNGLRFWNSDNYKISMGASALYYYGPVTDYSIKMQMNDGDTGRGFTWGRISYAPIAALNSTSGDMEIAGYFKSYGYRSNSNVGGVGSASWHPDGIYCGSTMWQYGSLNKNNTGIYNVSEMTMYSGPTLSTYNTRNLIVRALDNNADVGILGQKSGGGFAFQIYGTGSSYGFLNGTWAAWDIRKAVSGAMYMNDNDSYYLQTNSTSNFYALNIQGNAVVHAGNIGSQSVSYAATSGSAGSVTGLTLTSSANNLNPDNVTQNQIGYNTSVSLFGQTDGGLYSSAYSSSWIHQIYGDFRSGQIAIRGKNSGSWQAWRVVLDSSNYTSYAPSLTGSGASGSWGISVTGSSASCSGNAATATTATNFNNGTSYSSAGVVYVDTLESVNTNDWLELTYYGGLGVRIGTGVNGNKALYAGSLYDAGNRVYSAGNPQVNISGNAATATNVAYSGLTGTVPTWNQNTTGNSATVGGYAPSGSVGANTVVIRDANNYIYAYYINSNVSETENPTINSFYTSNGDGWLRKSSVAHVKSQLGLGSMAYESSGTYQTVSGAINTGNIASQSVSYATISQQLTKFGDIYGQDWNSYFITAKLIVSNALGHTGANRPSDSYGYGTVLSYGETGGPLMQMYFPEDVGNTGGAYRALAYRSGYNGGWSPWKTVVNQVGNTCTVAGSNGTGLQVHSNVGYNQNPLTYFLLRGQADSSWKTFKILLTGDAGGQDIEFRRIAENNTDARMFYVPRGLNQVIFDYTVVQPSDSRLKDNLTPITNPVDKIKSLRGVEFDWNSGEHVGTHDVGLIAQDVEAVLPEAVTTQEDGYKNLAYTKVIPLLVEAMKEQQTMIEALRAEIELLKNK